MTIFTNTFCSLTTMINYLGLTIGFVLFHKLCFVAEVANSVGIFKTITTSTKPIWNDTHMDKLKKDLLLNYDRFVRPENHNNVTEIMISLTVLRLETDEARSVVIVDGWINLAWSDSKLKWNEEDYGRLAAIRIADHEVWQPDIYLYNSVSDGEQLSEVGGKNVLVYPNGQVLWVPTIKLTAICDFNLRYWPFDKQHCPLKFTSWTLNSKQLKYKNYTDLTVKSSFGAWNIEGNSELINAEYPCCTDSYDKVVFHLNITRKMTPYCAIVLF
ncbi:hypothetical protein RN001_011191 [Aquatica leii]|uniref:Neurotransmitter-gated ion-channel ligand-binding domain-containing protein n=1 Tax=Aquatica leii TaxID=1421715 RepID=A0AAN7SQP3_9COLE|nr:hypothetical protein RN001_011191 [Aquatica leii]